MVKVNLTPHPVSITGVGTIEPNGPAVRVVASFTEFDADGVCSQTFGELINMPDPVDGTLYIVSGLALAAAKAIGRTDCIKPATNHPDVVKDATGCIVSVPGFVR